MKIVTLLENKSNDDLLKSSHGFSLYVEWNDKKILFDLGPNKYYLKNAKRLGLDLKEIDIVVVSHGHYDHGKRLNHFMKYNKNAKIFISQYAFDEHVFKLGSLKKDIGIKPPKLTNNVHYIDGTLQLEKGLLITSYVEYKENILSDERLYVKKDGEFKKDDFEHEIYLILQDNDKNVLLTGCSHKGIRNIVDSLEKQFQFTLDYVVGGYHLMRYDKSKLKHNEYLEDLADSFRHRKTKFFACHCTGDEAFDKLQNSMENLYPLHTGSVIEI